MYRFGKIDRQLTRPRIDVTPTPTTRSILPDTNPPGELAKIDLQLTRPRIGDMPRRANSYPSIECKSTHLTCSLTNTKTHNSHLTNDNSVHTPRHTSTWSTPDQLSPPRGALAAHGLGRRSLITLHGRPTLQLQSADNSQTWTPNRRNRHPTRGRVACARLARPPFRASIPAGRASPAPAPLPARLYVRPHVPEPEPEPESRIEKNGTPDGTRPDWPECIILSGPAGRVPQPPQTRRARVMYGNIKCRAAGAGGESQKTVRQSP